ncbi:MAG: tryptophan/tyrosine permease [marine bacterium B5-7]|nr:MAG: tryptophan/tyrosine permease [marine bacterium B5-7]
MNKTIGSILMIIGTSVGAGMLALPLVTAHSSISLSILVLTAAWLLMTCGALALLEVNLWLPADCNLITMAKHTLGRWGQMSMWLLYLLLLYSLVCAYLSGSGDILKSLLDQHSAFNMPLWLATMISLALFICIVYRGIRAVDLTNRVLMSVKCLAYTGLVIALMPHIQLPKLYQGDFQWHHTAFMVMITAFGYAIIIPSLRPYLDSNRQRLIKVVAIGSLIPWAVYLLWIVVVQGLLPRTGTHGLLHILHSAQPNGALMLALSSVIHSAWLANVSKLFISICVVTSFLGVSICLVDFLADGLQYRKQGRQGIAVFSTAFLPPLCIVLIKPALFVLALHYAGIWCICILSVLPILMLYAGRYRQMRQGKTILPGGKILLWIALLANAIVFVFLFK